MASILQRENGAWQAKIRLKRQSVSKTFSTKAAAVRWARETEADIERGAFVDLREAESTTLRQALERYANEVTPAKRGADVERYRLASLQTHKIARKSLAALRGTDFAGYRDERLKSGCAAATVQKELVLLSHVFKTAIREWGMESLRNPLDAVKKPSVNNSRNRVLLPGEAAWLLAACEPQTRTDGRFTGGAQSPCLKPAVQLALDTAMRLGEIIALRWENIDLQRRVAHLPMTKNGTSRDVPLSPGALQTLQDMLAAREIRAILAGQVMSGLTTNALKIAFGRAVKRARSAYEADCKANVREPDPRMLTNLHFHDLRHVATTQLAEFLPNVIELAAVTGHRDLRMLKRYYHPRAEDLAMKLAVQPS